jgi:RHS repeat-associated protein
MKVVSRSYRYGFNGQEKDNEIKGEGNSVDMGARMLDTRLGRTGSLDPKMGLYPGISPYAYALNTPINAIDPDGQLVIFVNGYRPCLPGVNVYREVKRNDQVFRTDKLGYWSGVDKQFMDRMGDHNSVYADGDAPTLTAGNKMGFNARVNHGRQAGQDLISKINSGEVVLQKNDAGEVIESIKVVSHSMGYAYSLGMQKELEAAGYKVEVSYNLAPENPKAGNIPSIVNRSVQYGSGPDDPWYQQDRIAPQSDIKNVGENAYIPDQNASGEKIPKGPIDSHLGANFGKWIFGIQKGKDGYVAPRQDKATDPPK